MRCCVTYNSPHRYQLFLQVKQDVLQGRLPVSFELATELGAFIIQCKYYVPCAQTLRRHHTQTAMRCCSLPLYCIIIGLWRALIQSYTINVCVCVQGVSARRCACVQHADKSINQCTAYTHTHTQLRSGAAFTHMHIRY